MIAFLRGTLAGKETGACIVEAGGVGYLVHVSMHTAERLPAVDEPVLLHTHQVVREDAHMLFGFADLEEKQVFELLIGVSGIGPKVALAVLSGLRPRALARSIRDENLAGLVAIPGVGRKTAERMVVELRDKMSTLALAAGEPSTPSPKAPPRSQQSQDGIAALVRLGYSGAQAQDAVRQVEDEGEVRSLEDLVRRALSRLGKASVAVR